MLTFDKVWESDGTVQQVLVMCDTSLDHFQMTLQGTNGSVICPMHC